MEEIKDRTPAQHLAPPPQLESEPDFDSGIDIDPEDLRPRAWVPPARSRVLLVLGILTVVALLVLLPPFISVNRFRRQIASSISASLGRPVHMGSVNLNILPMPGFTLQDFVVGEDPGFGSEPVIQARSVTVTLRVSSLWRRHVEFSRISLNDPSVNLVHRADGRWNIESILLQASKIEAAPTAQKSAGYAPRFPYIEATGARVNIKMGLEKMPLALTEAEFALWLPQPQQWRLRLEGHPNRTDATATDTGTLRLQGTLGKASTLQQVPVDLTGEWRNAPLGGVSWFLMAHDAGLRGEMNLRTHIQGTVGDNSLESSLNLSELRRADFVPDHPLDASINCKAHVLAIFHALRNLDCAWLTGDSVQGSAVGVRIQADLPDLQHPETAQYKADGLLPLSLLLDTARVASHRVSPALHADGYLLGELDATSPSLPPDGRFRVAPAKLTLADQRPFLNASLTGELAQGELTVPPIPFNFGAPQPALLSAHADRNGFQMHLTGPILPSRLMQFATALPQFGDGLAEALPQPTEPTTPETPIRVDLVSNRNWTNFQIGQQTWTPAPPTRPARKRARH
jgi:hypothetical protein